MSADVKRYVMTGDGAMVEPKCHAEFFADTYVCESDYAALAQERDGLRLALETAEQRRAYEANACTAAESERDALKEAYAEQCLATQRAVEDFTRIERRIAEAPVGTIITTRQVCGHGESHEEQSVFMGSNYNNTLRPELNGKRVRLVLDDDTAATLRREEKE